METQRDDLATREFRLPHFGVHDVPARNFDKVLRAAGDWKKLAIGLAAMLAYYAGWSMLIAALTFLGTVVIVAGSSVVERSLGERDEENFGRADPSAVRHGPRVGEEAR